MGNEFQNSEPRSRFIVRRTSEILRKAPMCVRKFAAHVAESYMGQVIEHERVLAFDIGHGSVDAACRAEVRNAKKIQHLLDGEVKFPADLEESWITALPQPHREEMIRQLAARYGLLGARLPGLCGSHPLADLAAFLRDAGDTATALAPLFMTGRLNAADLPHLRSAQPIIARAVADCTSLLAQIGIAIEAKPVRAVDSAA